MSAPERTAGQEGQINFPNGERIKDNQQIFRDKFHEIFLAKWKKSETLVRKARRNAKDDTVDASAVQVPSGDSTIDICEENNSTFDEIYDMTLGRRKQSKARGIYRTLSRAGDGSVESIMKSVGGELATAFQYQLSMLAGPLEIEKVAKFAVRAIMHYIKSPDAVFTEVALIEAVLEEHVKGKVNETQWVKTDFPHHKDFSGIYWTAEGIFREPGIRWPNDIIPCTDDVTDGQSTAEPKVRFSGSFTPLGCWCRPDVYGYRAPLHVRDSEGKTNLLYRDRVTLCRQQNPSQRPDLMDNVHRHFTPRSA